MLKEYIETLGGEGIPSRSERAKSMPVWFSHIQCDLMVEKIRKARTKQDHLRQANLGIQRYQSVSLNKIDL